MPQIIVRALTHAFDFQGQTRQDFVAGGETDDEIAAAWLYAWAYDAIRPPQDNLAARIIDRAARAQTPNRNEALDAAIDGRGRGAHRTLGATGARFSADSSSLPRSCRSSTPAAHQALDNCTASDAAAERSEVR